MTTWRLTVLRLMDPVSSDRPGDDGPPDRPAALDPAAPLGELLVGMRSDSPALREAAWGACYKRYHQVVWTRVFYVLRAIPWLGEPAEVAADVASDVFVGLPDAARQYREEGKAESWLKQVAVRAALRRKEELTGRWATGKKAGESEPSAPPSSGRRYVPFEETADQIVTRLDAIEPEERIELERRLDALRNSPNETERRWAEFLDLYVAGYGFKEIGERMGLTEASARNWLCKIRKYLARPPDGV